MTAEGHRGKPFKTRSSSPKAQTGLHHFPPSIRHHRVFSLTQSRPDVNWVSAGRRRCGQLWKANVNQAASKTGSVVAQDCQSEAVEEKMCRRTLSSNQNIRQEKHLQNGIQSLKKYRDQVTAPASVRNASIVLYAPCFWDFSAWKAFRLSRGSLNGGSCAG